MLDQPKQQTKATHLAELPLRLHHHAYAVKDQEINRQFFEEILGLPLIATWCERVFNKEVGRDVDYCHTFYGLADGSALAFFQFADDDVYQKSKALLPEGGGTWHIALKVTKASFDELLQRVKAHHLPHRTIRDAERFKDLRIIQGRDSSLDPFPREFGFFDQIASNVPAPSIDRSLATLLLDPFCVCLR